MRRLARSSRRWPKGVLWNANNGPRKSRQSARKKPSPTRANVAYGDHERQVLDFWSAADTDGPAPVFVWIHGGGFPVATSHRFPPICLAAASTEAFRLHRFTIDFHHTLHIRRDLADGGWGTL